VENVEVSELDLREEQEIKLTGIEQPALCSVFPIHFYTDAPHQQKRGTLSRHSLLRHVPFREIINFATVGPSRRFLPSLLIQVVDLTNAPSPA
jgi:hypothetical protein